MTTLIKHTINSRTYTTRNEEQSGVRIEKQKNYLFDLSYLGIIDLAGDNASEFLQGQLTCDLNVISDIQMIQGAQCNLKGRILSLLDIINWNGIKLILPQDLIEVTMSSLSRAAQLSKVTLKANTDLDVFGFYLQNPQDLVPNVTYFPQELYALAYNSQYCYYHLGNGFYIFLVKKNEESPFSSIFMEHNQVSGSLQWHTLRLLQNQVDIYPESRGLFLPHRLGLHETTYINFNKGCYKGQEIIARTHYRATIKHELRTYNIVTRQKIYSGQKLFKCSEEREIGELIDYSYLGDDHYLIAVSILKEPASNARFEGHSDDTKLEPSVRS